MRLPPAITTHPLFSLNLMAILYYQLADGEPEAGYVPPDNQVKCFCDKLHCPGSLTCVGKWCLIGMRNGGDDHGRLDQVCGWDDAERPAGCAQSWHKWAEVCACEEPFCNTFAFLRASIDSSRQQRSRNGEIVEDLVYLSDGGGGGEHGSGDPLHRGTAPGQRIGGGWTGWHKSGDIVLLVIVMPLCVGGFAVLFIFLNYHCKMG